MGNYLPNAWLALREALIVLIVAIFVTALIYGFGLRQAGSDLSQRLLVAADQSPLGFSPPRANVDHPPRSWVLVDVDLEPCAGAGTDCDLLAALKGERLARLLRRVRAARPRLVVVHVLVAGGVSGEPVDSALASEFNRPGPPILVAWSARPSMHEHGRGLIHVNETDQALLRPGAFRFAQFVPALIAGHPSARGLLPAICVQGPEGPPHVLPTLPYAGAAIAAAPARGLRRTDFPIVALGDPATEGSDPCAWLPDAPESADFARTERVFSAGSLRADTDSADSSYWPSAGQWLHFRSRRGNEEALPMRAMTDGVVVIGSASPDTSDTHWTGLGDMTGVEIVLNDLRQFSLTSPQPKPGFWKALLGKWPFFLAGLLAAFLIALVPVRRASEAPEASLRARAWTRLRAALASAARLTLMLALAAVLFVILFWLMPHHLGAPPDFVTPFIALAFEGLFEFGFRLVLALRLLLGLPTHGEPQ